MRRLFILFPLLLTASCTITEDDFPATLESMNSSLASDRAAEVRMITDIQDADRRLLFLSAGEYSCGDPQDTRLKELVRSEFPDTYVNKHYNTAWNESIAFISTYADFLDNFAKTNAASQAKLTAVNEAADSLAAIIPAAAPLATLAKPAVTTAGAFQGAVAAAQVRNEAARLSTTLKQSKATIIKAYDIVKSERNRIFRQWDACEREALIFMRDAPLGKVGRYEIRSAKSTAIELDVAFAAYLEKRRTYRKVTDIEKSLEALEKENRHLITVANKGLAQAAANTAKEVVALSKTVEGMN